MKYDVSILVSKRFHYEVEAEDAEAAEAIAESMYISGMIPWESATNDPFSVIALEAEDE